MRAAEWGLPPASKHQSGAHGPAPASECGKKRECSRTRSRKEHRRKPEIMTNRILSMVKPLALSIFAVALLTLAQGVARADEVFIAGFTNGCFGALCAPGAAAASGGPGFSQRTLPRAAGKRRPPRGRRPTAPAPSAPTLPLGRTSTTWDQSA